MKNFIRIAALLLFLFPLISKAGEVGFNNRINGSDLITGASLVTSDDRLPLGTYVGNAWKGNTQYESVSNRIYLGIDHSDPTLYPNPFSVTLTMKVIYWDEMGIANSINRTLEVNYDPAAGISETDKSVLVLSGGHRVEVQIQGYSVTGGLYFVVPDNVYLENEIVVNRYEPFNPIIGSTLGLSKQYIYPEDQLEVRWDFVPGAEMYDLEWTFVSVAGYTSAQVPALEYDFQNNASRIRVSENFYRLPLTYEDGYLLWRIRAVGLAGADRNQRIHSDWTSVQYGGDQGTMQNLFGTSPDHYWDVQWHEQPFNWRASMTFAEEGKRSNSVSYFDGTLRERQGVSQSREENTAIVGEIFYDHQGRPAIQSMPVPSFQPALKYHQNFSMSGGINGGHFGRNDFDLSTNGNCDLILNSMDNVSGAGKYYSGSSINEYSSGYFAVTPTSEQYRTQNFVPDAQGFPFTHTTYTSDNTGRIRSQSGPGPDHKTGSGHEVKYFYGDAEQEDLDRLFGSEVGFCEHYRKNMVTDPNGQVSISYLDGSGRVIATALAGESPEGIDALAENLERNLEKDLLPGQEIDLEAGTLIASREFLVSTEGTHTFDYEITAETLEGDCILNDPNFCYDCIYDLEISVKDDCGREMLDGGIPFTAQIGGIEYNSACRTTPLVFNLQSQGGSLTATNLPIGKYSVIKKLTVAPEAIEAYTTLFLQDNACLYDFDYFLEDELANIDTSGCYLSCDDCPKDADPGGGGGTIDSSSFDAVACDLYCQVNWCQYLYEIMLDDLSPGGQYAILDFSGGIQALIGTEISIFGGGGCLPGSASGSFPFQNPCSPYLQSDGTPSAITLANGVTFTPDQLTLQDFVGNWRPSWAKSLVCYHPENCFYQNCQSLDASHEYYTDMLATDTYSSAESQGFLNPIGSSAYNFTINKIDPYFIQGSSAFLEMAAKLNNFKPTGFTGPNLTMWEAAAQSVNCPDGGNPCNPVFGANSTTQDEEWKLFRMFFISTAQMLQEEDFEQNNPACKANMDLPGSQTTCNSTNWGDKVRRSPDFSSSLPGMDLTNPGTTAGNIGTLAQSQLQTHCQSTCESYIDAWKLKLQNSTCFSGCGFSGNQQNFYDALAGVCALGCDVNNPLGSSNTIPGTQFCQGSNCFTSFEDVFTFYFPFCGNQVDCNPNLLNFPMPYGHDPFTDNCFGGLQHVLKLNESFENGWNSNWGSDLVQATNTCDANCLPVNGGSCPSNFNSASNSGEFIIGHDAGCHSPMFWQGVAAFPTSGNSNFLIVNGKDTCLSGQCPGWKVWEETGIQVSANNKYEVSVWVKNLDTKYFYPAAWKDPILELRINGVQVAGPVVVSPGQKWTQIKAFWQAPGSLPSSSVLTLYNYNYSSQNDFGVDEISIKLLGDECCIECLDLNPELIAFEQLYNTNSTAPNYWQTVSTILNKKFGFNLTTNDWENFKLECDNWQSPDPDPRLCNKSLLPELDYTDPCVSDALNQAWANATSRYTTYLNESKANFRRAYIEKCLEAAETFQRFHPDREYQYTLFYYDLVGNLIQTVPPEGVNPITQKALLDQAIVYRDYRAGLANGQQGPGNPPSSAHPGHGLKSKYQFNSLNQVAEASTPDRGISKFWYDNLGRPYLSQDARQAAQSPEDYSYTFYDALGRAVEAGQVPSPMSSSSSSLLQSSILLDVSQFVRNGNDANQIIRTWYDSQQVLPSAVLDQEQLRSRVASIEYHEDLLSGAKYASHYSYDAHGNVNDLIQEISALQFMNQGYKHIEYDYDLIGGSVNVFRYQPGKSDQWLHRYHYDADYRLKVVETSRNGVTWDRDAKYFYYLHGPLARVEIGNDKVQGMDFYYTLQGWLRGMNSGTLEENRDPAMDADATNPNWVHAKTGSDEMGFELGYFQGDYQPINSFNGVDQPFTTVQTGTNLDADHFNLYNGNIAHMVSGIRHFMPKGGASPLFKRYKYDQLNRIKEMQVYLDPQVSFLNQWGSQATPSQEYHTSYSFDRNGNLLNLTRNADASASQFAMDDLSYHYPSTNGMLTSNRLLHVNDAVSSTGLDDLQDQGTFVAGNSTTHNYAYDEIGNLIRDNAENISNIQWDVFGKVKKVSKTSGSIGQIEFGYDAMGNRVEKSTEPSGASQNTPKSYTYYVRDAQGTPIAMYSREVVNGTETQVKLTELGIFGSKRLGLLKQDLLVGDAPWGGGGSGGKSPLFTTTGSLDPGLQNLSDKGSGSEPIPNSGPFGGPVVFDHRIGERMYELTEHRGNVNSVVTDRRLPKDIGGNSLADYYIADNVSSLSYYPYGMVMPGREYSSPVYRYGFQGQERDDEVKGNGNSWNYKFRMHDPRVGRFFAVDPLAAKYPHNSVYAFSENRVVDGVELEGLEWKDSNTGEFIDGPYSQEFATSQGWEKQPEVSLKSVSITADISSSGKGFVLGIADFLYSGTIYGTYQGIEAWGDQIDQGNPTAIAAIFSYSYPIVVQGKEVFQKGTTEEKVRFSTYQGLDLISLFAGGRYGQKTSSQSQMPVGSPNSPNLNRGAFNSRNLNFNELRNCSECTINWEASARNGSRTRIQLWEGNNPNGTQIQQHIQRLRDIGANPLRKRFFFTERFMTNYISDNHTLGTRFSIWGNRGQQNLGHVFPGHIDGAGYIRYFEVQSYKSVQMQQYSSFWLIIHNP